VSLFGTHNWQPELSIHTTYRVKNNISIIS
jgi:hypothetical protein